MEFYNSSKRFWLQDNYIDIYLTQNEGNLLLLKSKGRRTKYINI